MLTSCSLGPGGAMLHWSDHKVGATCQHTHQGLLRASAALHSNAQMCTQVCSLHMSRVSTGPGAAGFSGTLWAVHVGAQSMNSELDTLTLNLDHSTGRPTYAVKLLLVSVSSSAKWSYY